MYGIILLSLSHFSICAALFSCSLCLSLSCTQLCLISSHLPLWRRYSPDTLSTSLTSSPPVQATQVIQTRMADGWLMTQWTRKIPEFAVGLIWIPVIPPGNFVPYCVQCQSSMYRPYTPYTVYTVCTYTVLNAGDKLYGLTFDLRNNTT